MLTRESYLEHLQGIIVGALQSSDGAIHEPFIRECIQYAKRGVDEREAVDIFLGELVKMSRGSFDAHQIKHLLASAGAVGSDQREPPEIPPPPPRGR
jgi:hypothetical protein